MATASGRRNWPTEYDLRLLLGKPRLLWMRRKERRRESLAIAFLEASRYRKAAYDFIGARMEDPGIMYNFDLTEGDLGLSIRAHLGPGRHSCVSVFESGQEVGAGEGVRVDGERHHGR